MNFNDLLPISGTYSFYITATANGSATLKQLAYVKVVINCTIDKISLNKVMPNYTEPDFKSYVKVGQYPVLILNKSLGTTYSVDITKRFTNLFPKDCPLTKFSISKVISKNEVI